MRMAFILQSRDEDILRHVRIHLELLDRWLGEDDGTDAIIHSLLAKACVKTVNDLLDQALPPPAGGYANTSTDALLDDWRLDAGLVPRQIREWARRERSSDAEVAP